MRLLTVGEGLLDEITEWSSAGVRIGPLALGGPSEETRVYLGRYAAGSVLGLHMAGRWQIFAVLEGNGWVSGDDEVRHALGPGQAVLWEPGDLHESGSDGGMSVCIVQSSSDPSTNLPGANL